MILNILKIHALFIFAFLLITPLSANSTGYGGVSEQDSIRLVKIKQEISGYLNPNPDSAWISIQKYKRKVEELDYDLGRIDVEYFYATYFRRTQNNDSAIYYLKRLMAFSEKIDSDKGKAFAYNGLCGVYSKEGLSDLALSNGKSCITYAKKINRPDIESANYLSIGLLYTRLDDSKNGLLYYLKVDSMNQIEPVRGDVLGAAYKNIGDVYLGFDDLEQAEFYVLKSKAVYEELPNNSEYYLKHSDVVLGQINYRKGELSEALHALLVCHAYFKEIKDDHTLALVDVSLGRIYFDLHKYDKGEVFLREGYEIHKEFGNIVDMAQINIVLSKLLIKKGSVDEAIRTLNNTYKLLPEVNNAELEKETHFALSEGYAQQKKFDLAFQHQSMGLKIKDSLQLAQNASQIRGIETQYQVKQKEREIEILTANNELIKEQKEKQKVLLMTGALLGGLTSIFFWFLYRNRQKTNRKLKEIDRAKSAFFTNISHEFRTPLTLISGPIQEELSRMDITGERRGKFEMIQRNSERLLNLVDQTLNLSKIESGNIALKVMKGDLCSFVGVLAEGFKFLIEEKDIHYEIDISHCEKELWFDSDAMEKILTNLLGNAVKYTEEGGSIVCKSRIENEYLILEVMNTGDALTKDEEKHLFDRFYQVHKEGSGFGVGLSLVKNLVALHKGEVTVQNCRKGWVCFKVVLPVSMNAFDELHLVLPERINKKKEINEIIVGQQEEKLPVMLVVDDNADVRSFVKSLFADDYSLLEASNGKEGIEVAIEYVPDIILSDVMMPIKNGIELCQALKENHCTSHIPIILLTAKVGVESELEGAKSGADDFVSKPFNIELLKTKVHGLIENRKKVREHYKQDVFVDSKEIVKTNVDRKLFEKIQSILEQKLDDSDFNVERFSAALGMSRMQLHRKLKAISGLSASEFIRSYRLKAAAKLLKESDMNVSEICYSVGFSDHAYFSKCFKKVFHLTPSDYLKKSRV